MGKDPWLQVIWEKKKFKDSLKNTSQIRAKVPQQKITETSSFLCGSTGKESACNVGDLGSISELGRSPGGGHGNPLQYSCLENPHGQSLSMRPRGRKELDMTERLSTKLSLSSKN